jgi:putative Holliday junction resolvase
VRVLAVDYGARRVGLALSDPLEITVNPHSVIPNRGDPAPVLDAIARVIAEEGVDEVVVGLPVNMDGSHGPAAQAAQEFAEALADRVAVPVHCYDERLTTAEAEEILIGRDVPRARRREMVDKVAAALILRSYLESPGRRRG